MFASGKIAESIVAAGIPEEHVRNAQRFYEKRELRLQWHYPSAEEAGWAICGARKMGEGRVWYHCMPVDLEAACGEPHTTVKAWEGEWRRNKAAWDRGQALKASWETF